MTKIDQEFPEEVFAVLADLEFFFDRNGYGKTEQIRFMGLFIYRQLQQHSHLVLSKELNKILGALNHIHTEHSFK